MARLKPSNPPGILFSSSATKALDRCPTAELLVGIDECPPVALPTTCKVTLPFSATLIAATYLSTPGIKPSSKNEPSSKDHSS